MKYLVDTHIFLWWLTNDKRLKDSIKNVISHPENDIIVSVVSGWELSIKLKKHKTFRFKTTIKECFQKAGFGILDVQFVHVLQLDKLKNFHNDPFDRMLVAQALVENAILITGDEKIWKYKVPLLKA